jgi:hypothetical protein
MHWVHNAYAPIFSIHGNKVAMPHQSQQICNHLNDLHMDSPASGSVEHIYQIAEKISTTAI